ncbi:MAG TPA: STAS-like domain-containing protein [Candidatus Baltobacteraceae bacterium]
MKLNLKEMIGEDCLAPTDGDRIYSIIHPELLADRQVTLDFTAVRVVVSLFLNQAIGKLYADVPPERIRANMTVVGLNDPGKFALRRVVDNSKNYYADKNYRAAIDRSIDTLEA